MTGTGGRTGRAARVAGTLAVVTAVLAPAGPGSPARADVVGNADGGGYEVTVEVRYSGDAAPGGGGVRRARVPATCWWSRSYGGVDGADTQAVLDMLNGRLAGTPPMADYPLGFLGPISRFGDAAGRTDVAWQFMRCRDGVDLTDPDVVRMGDGSASLWGSTYPVMARLVAPGTPLPPPLIDPADLAAAARDAMVIVTPEIDRNPKVASLGGSTLVNLPTWFWVTDPAAVGGASGTRTIRAEVVGGGRPVRAQVVATTGGLTVSSPDGAVSCSPARALVRWDPSVPPDRACSVEFGRASVAYPRGYPVEADVAWTATWTGTGRPAPQPLPARTAPTFRVFVPVAEVQAVVGNAR